MDLGQRKGKWIHGNGQTVGISIHKWVATKVKNKNNNWNWKSKQSGAVKTTAELIQQNNILAEKMDSNDAHGNKTLFIQEI